MGGKFLCRLRKREELREGPLLTAAAEGTREVPWQPSPTEHGAYHGLMPWRLAPLTHIIVQGDSNPDAVVPGGQRSWARFHFRYKLKKKM